MTRSSQKSPYAPWKKANARGKKWLKAITLGLVLLLGGAGALVLLLDRDTLRESIAQSLSEKTGTQVEIQFLDLGFSRGLGLEAGGLTVRTGGRQLLWAESLFLEVKIWPLLTGEVVIENAVIIKPRIKVYLDPQDSPSNEFKKASLSDPDKKKARGNTMTKVMPLEKPVQAQLSPPQPAPSPLIDRRIIDEFRNRLKKFHFTAKNIHVEQGTLQVIRNGPPEPRETEPLGFSFDLKIRRPDPGVVDVILENVHLDLGPLFLLGRMEADDVLSDTSRLEVQLRTQPFSLTELVQTLQPHLEEKSDTPANPVLPVRIEQLTLLASCPLNSLADGAALRRDLKAETRFVTGDAQIPVGDYQLAVSQVKGKVRWEKGFILYNIQGEALNGKVRIDGQLPFPLPSEDDPSPYIETEVQLTGLDLSRLTAPEGWAPPQGRFSGILKVAIPRTLDGPPRVTGSLVGENLTLAAKNFKLASLKTEIQFESPPDKPMTMDWTSEQVTVDQVRFRKVAGKVSLAPGKIVLAQSTWTPAHGTLSVHGTYDTESRKYQLKFLGKNLRAGDYTRNQIQGFMRAHGSLNGYVPEKLPGIRGLFGTVSIKVSPVTFDKSEAVKRLLKVIDPVFSRKPSSRGLRFDYLGGNFKIINGKFNTSNLALKGEPMDVYFEGIFDGYNQTLNMVGRALPKFNRSTARKASPQLARMLSKVQAESGLIETHFKLDGPISRPQIRLLGIKPRLKKNRR